LWGSFVGTAASSEHKVGFRFVNTLVAASMPSEQAIITKTSLAAFPQLRDITSVVLPASRVVNRLLGKSHGPSFYNSAHATDIVEMAFVSLEACVALQHAAGSDAVGATSPFSESLSDALMCASVHVVLQHAPFPQRDSFDRITALLTLPTVDQPLTQFVGAASCAYFRGWTVDTILMVGYVAARFVNTPLLSDILHTLQKCEYTGQLCCYSSQGEQTNVVDVLRVFASQMCALGAEELGLITNGGDDVDVTLLTAQSKLTAATNAWISAVGKMSKIIGTLIVSSTSSAHNSQPHVDAQRESLESSAYLDECVVELISFISDALRGDQLSIYKFNVLLLDAQCVLAWFLAKQESCPQSSSGLRLNTFAARLGNLSVDALNSRSLHQRIAALRAAGAAEIDTPLYCWCVLSLFESSNSVVVAISSTELDAFRFLRAACQHFPNLDAQFFGIELWRKAAAHKLYSYEQSSLRIPFNVWQEIVDAMPAPANQRTMAISIFSPTTRPTPSQLFAFIESVA
jgi:hypothetical protein